MLAAWRSSSNILQFMSIPIENGCLRFRLMVLQYVYMFPIWTLIFLLDLLGPNFVYLEYLDKHVLS